MHSRCANPRNRDYPSTGGRGISVCEGWYTFDAFWADMGTGWSKGMTLQRINKDRNFYPGNCIWAKREDICAARRGREKIPLPGGAGMTSVYGLSKATGIPEATIRSRIKRGWPPHELGKRVDVTRSSRARA